MKRPGLVRRVRCPTCHGEGVLRHYATNAYMGAWDRGYEAYRKGRPQESCDQGYNREAWLLGWQYAQSRARRRRSY